MPRRHTVGLNVTLDELRILQDIRFAERHESLSALLRSIVMPTIRRRHRKLNNAPVSSRKTRGRRG